MGTTYERDRKFPLSDKRKKEFIRSFREFASEVINLTNGMDEDGNRMDWTDDDIIQELAVHVAGFYETHDLDCFSGARAPNLKL